jgi:hypothetical protein
MKTKRKVTPHTVFVYSHGNFLRVVRGQHLPPHSTIKPRVYPTVKEALENERKKRIMNLLKMMPSDKLIDRRLKAMTGPISESGANKKLSEAVKSRLFLFAQTGYDINHQEIAYVYHRNPTSQRGLSMVSKGPVPFVRKLLKKYKKPALRGLNYRERKRA